MIRHLMRLQCYLIVIQQEHSFLLEIFNKSGFPSSGMFTVTLTTLVKSEHAFEWICEDINQMGNCSSLPNFSLLLKNMDDDSKTNKYSNTYYCPLVY